MTAHAIILLLFGLVAGAGVSTLVISPNPMPRDRMIVAALGGAAGLIGAAALIVVGHAAVAAWSALGG